MSSGGWFVGWMMVELMDDGLMGGSNNKGRIYWPRPSWSGRTRSTCRPRRNEAPVLASFDIGALFDSR